MAPEDEFDQSDLADLFDLDQKAADTVIDSLVADGFLERVGRRAHVKTWSPSALAHAFDTGAAIEASVMAHVAGRPAAHSILAAVDGAIEHARSGDTAYESAIRDIEIGSRIVAAGGTDQLLAMYDGAAPVAVFYHAAGCYRPQKAWLAHLRALRVGLKANDAGATGCEVMTWRASMVDPSSSRPNRRAVGHLT